MIGPSISFFLLEVLEKTFTARVVKGVAFLGERMNYIKLIKELLKGKSGILRAHVRVEHKPISNISLMIGKLKGSHDKIDISLRGEMP